MLIASLVLAATMSHFAGPDRGDDPLDSLIANEIAFSDCSVREGMNAAFLKFVDDTGILLRPRPVSGKSWLRGRTSPQGTLAWKPAFAIRSASGDLGFTTGPWQWRGPSDSVGPSAIGDFVTAWKKGPDGSWKFVFDMGSDYPLSAVQPNGVLKPAPLWKQGNGSDRDSSQWRVLRKDFAGPEGPDVVTDQLDEEIVLLRQDVPTIHGISSARSFLSQSQSNSVRHLLSTSIARSHDLAFTYGTVERETKALKRTECYYCTIWRRGSDGIWRMLIDTEGAVVEDAGKQK
jgi:ketosteroid isomerase-like protein